jgi:hypothetical protein
MNAGSHQNIPLVLIREAVRLAELRLSAQAQARQVLEARATATTQFLVTLTITLTAGQFTLSALNKAGELPTTIKFGATIAAVATMTGFSTVALVVSIASLAVANAARRKPPWHLAGAHPEWVWQDVTLPEEDALLSLAKRYGTSIENNEAALSRMWFVSWLAIAIFVSGVCCSYVVGWWKLFADIGAG